MDDAQRHLALLTRTTEVVNSSLDLQEVLEAIAHEVAAALETDACFVYLYDERADELVLRATHGTPMEVATSAPRMRRGDGITGVAAAERTPIMIPSGAHLDPRFKAFPNLREEEYESILAVPILARDVLEGALNVRTRTPRAFTEAEIALLTSIASQVGAVDRAREALCAGTAPRPRARGARAHLGGRVRVALPRGVARGDRLDDGRVAPRHGRGDRPRGRSHRVARRAGGRPRRSVSRSAGAAARSGSSSSIATPRSPTTTGSCSMRSRTRPPSRSSTGAWRCGASSPRRSTIA